MSTSAAQRGRDYMRKMELGHGLIWKNRDKDPNNPDHQKWSDYDGECNVEGVFYFMNLWVNTAENGHKYFSVRFKRKQSRNLKTNDAAPA